MTTAEKKVPLKEFIKHNDNFYIVDGNIGVKRDCVAEITLNLYATVNWGTGDGIAGILRRLSDNGAICNLGQHINNPWEGFTLTDVVHLNAGDVLVFNAKNGTYARGEVSTASVYTNVIVKEL